MQDKSWTSSFLLDAKSFSYVCMGRYHVPRSWFKPSGNILVIFEEKGGDPTKIRISKRKTAGVCALISEDHPTFELDALHPDANENNRRNKAAIHLKCPENTLISTVKFASYGTPTGKCGSYSLGDCHDPNSTSVVEKVRTLLPLLLLLSILVKDTGSHCYDSDKNNMMLIFF